MTAVRCCVDTRSGHLRPAAAILIGTGVGVNTPIGFAHLAATIPSERLGQTFGAAEVGVKNGGRSRMAAGLMRKIAAIIAHVSTVVDEPTAFAPC